MSFAGKWNWRESIISSEMNTLRKTNLLPIFSYEWCRPKNNDMNVKGGVFGGGPVEGGRVKGEW
jgi:hypothetical protein